MEDEATGQGRVDHRGREPHWYRFRVRSGLGREGATLAVSSTTDRIHERAADPA